MLKQRRFAWNDKPSQKINLLIADFTKLKRQLQVIVKNAKNVVQIYEKKFNCRKKAAKLFSLVKATFDYENDCDSSACSRFNHQLRRV